MSNKIKPLCLSFWTPPVVRPQAILIGKMIPEWLSQGLKPVIISYENDGPWDIEAPIFKIPQFQLNKFLYRLFSLRAFLKQRYYEKIFLAAEEVIKKYNPDLVFSFANPQDSNILGAMLKDWLGIKFISHFSDPWSDNPLRSLTGPEKKQILEKEKYIIKNSDKVVFINSRLRDLVMRKYPNEWRPKAVVIPHAYRPEDYPLVRKVQGQRFVFSHIGSFYPQRTPEALFKAFKDLLSRRPDLGQEFVLRLVGADSPYTNYSLRKLKTLIELYHLKDVVELMPTVNYKESLKQMKLADCLIVIDIDLAQSPCLPSKLVDYAGSDRMILGIAHCGTPVADFLANLAYPCFAHHETKKLADYLEQLILRRVNVQVNKDYLKDFDIKTTTSRLIEVFKEVTT